MSWHLISWRSIIAGVVAALAVSIIMATLGTALGFSVINPTSDSPFAGLGTAIGIWSIVSIIVSLAVGGFVAGYFSGTRGAEHGFMVWSTVLIVAAAFSGLALGSAARTVGAVAGGVGSGVATVAETVGEGAAGLASAAVNGLRENVNLDLDAGELRGDVAQVLRDTGIPTLQPSYLQTQMSGARSDFRSALNQLDLDSGNFQQVMTGYVERQRDRLQGIADGVDRNAAVTALMQNRGMNRADAERAVDNALAAYNAVAARAELAMTEAQNQIEDAREHLAVMAARARQRAEEFASFAAKSALAAAVALLIGAVVCCLAGMYGSRMTSRDAILIEERRDIEIPLEHTVRPDARLDRPVRTDTRLERP